MTSALEDRLVEMVFKFIDGDLDSFAKWLERIGATIERKNEDEIIFRGPSGIGTGLLRGMDPINAAVCIGLAVAGLFWPQVFPNLLKKVDAEWKKRRKGEPKTARKKNNRIGPSLTLFPESW